MTGITKSVQYGAHTLTLKLAKLPVRHLGLSLHRSATSVLVTVVASRNADHGRDFFPLTIDYKKTYAAGKIPGGFFKREGRPSEKRF